MTALDWEEAAVAKIHDRAAFDCGNADLNLYLQRYARQNHESNGAKCFVAVPAEKPSRILGLIGVQWNLPRRAPHDVFLHHLGHQQELLREQIL
jgi:hypothetical protein